MLTKDLLRVSRRGGGYQPQFADEEDQSLAGRVIGCYQGHVGESREQLQEALDDIEHESDDFKLVRGFAKLVDREATWAVDAAVDPHSARTAAFEASEAIGVITEQDRDEALERAADTLGTTAAAVETALYADRTQREILTGVDTAWSAGELVAQYNLSLAQTALFDATELRIRSADPGRIISELGRLRLLYEIRMVSAENRRTVADTDREIVVTGPDALFRKTRRYGTRFARLLRTVAKTGEWQIQATIDDRGTERELVLTDADLSVPDSEPVVEVSYDSDVEAEFARRFESLDLDWDLRREPDAIEAGEYVVIPDFAFDWQHGDFRVYFEIMGFWTPEYVAKKLDRFDRIENVELLVAVDESLGVAEEIETRDHRAIPYTGTVPIKAIRNALRRYEDELVSDAAATVPDEIRPENDVITLRDLADSFGVSERSVESKEFPEHERVGRTLVRPAVLDELAEKIDDGMELSNAENILQAVGIDDSSAALAALGYRVEWDGLSGGVLRERENE